MYMGRPLPLKKYLHQNNTNYNKLVKAFRKKGFFYDDLSGVMKPFIIESAFISIVELQIVKSSRMLMYNFMDE